MTVLAARPTLSDPVLWQFPELETWSRPSGLAGHHLRLDGEGMLRMAVFIPAPLSAEPRDREGITELCARVLTEGAGREQDFPASLDRIAATIWSQVGVDGVTVGLDVPTHRASEGLRLLGSALTAPAFADEDVQRHRREMQAELRMRDSDGPAVAELALWRSLYPETDRRSRPLIGSESSVSRLDRDAVHEWFTHVVRLDRAQFVSVGAIRSDELVDALETAIGTVASDALSTSRASAPTSAVPPRTVFIDRPGATQTAIEIATAVSDCSGAEWAALKIVTRILAEGMRSRLNLVLREQKGYTYGVHGSAQRGSSGGVFRIRGTVNTEATGAALRDALDILDDFRTSGPTPAELHDAIDAIISRTPIRHQTGRDILNTALAGVTTGLATDWLTSELSDVRDHTPESVIQTYRRLLSARPTVVIAGDARVCMPLLTEAGIVVDAQHTVGEVTP
ncbi:M16 family metallopeptidase [Microbacterium natoriense]